MRIGILTGGGDCPGLNAVIRAVVRLSTDRGHEMVAVRDGWKGLTEGLFAPLGRREVSGILPRGGTILGTTRTNPYHVDGGVRGGARALRASERLDALVAIGGEDTLGVAAQLHREHAFPVVGVPKTIDNDLSGTDYTFGFDTAMTIATEAIDRLHTTAESHNRVMVVEVMGRHTGWIAVMSGIAGGADVILIPEQPITVEQACAELVKRHEGGKDFSIVVVSEGYELTYESGEQRLVAGRGARDRPVRPRRPRRRRRRAGAGDRAAHGLRDARLRARARAARRNADPARPHPRHAVRAEGGRARPRGAIRAHGCPARRRDRRRLARGGDERGEDGSGRVVRGRRPSFGDQPTGSAGRARLRPGALDATIDVRAGVAELADARDSKSRVLRDVWVRPPPPASSAGTDVALELPSAPNGSAVRILATRRRSRRATG